MNKFIHLLPFVECLFDDVDSVKKAKSIVEGILKARSPRLSDIACEMAGKEASNYKEIQRFLASHSPQQALKRLFQESAPFMIEDPIVMPRSQAKKSEYVGTLSDGKTSGYWLLILAALFHVHALPCHFVDYSSRTINDEATLCNRHHFEAFEEIKELLGEKPLVLDREFSYLESIQNLFLEKFDFVIRLKEGTKFTDQEGKLVALSVQIVETRILNKVFYVGKVCVNVIGIWRERFSKPIWVMASLDAKQGLDIYLQRMKIGESFRACSLSIAR